MWSCACRLALVVRARRLLLLFLFFFFSLSLSAFRFSVFFLSSSSFFEENAFFIFFFIFFHFSFAFPFLSPHCSLVKRSGFSSLVEYISTRIHSSRTEMRTFPHPHVPIRHSMRHRNMRHMISAWTDERIRITISAQSQVIKGVLTPIVRLRYLYLRIIFPMEMFKKKPNGDGRKESRKFFFNM